MQTFETSMFYGRRLFNTEARRATVFAHKLQMQYKVMNFTERNEVQKTNMVAGGSAEIFFCTKNPYILNHSLTFPTRTNVLFVEHHLFFHDKSAIYTRTRNFDISVHIV